jgi:hypothetical protein
MKQSDFNNAFTELMIREFGPGTSPQQMALEIFRRDQRRTRVYAILSLSLWSIGTAGMLLMVIGLNRLVLSMRIAPFYFPRQTTTQPEAHEIARMQEQVQFWGTDLIHHSLPYVGGAVIALLLAALFTVLYVSSSRQATLTRINISLMQMSEELNQMRAGTTGNKTTGS